MRWNLWKWYAKLGGLGTEVPTAVKGQSPGGKSGTRWTIFITWRIFLHGTPNYKRFVIEHCAPAVDQTLKDSHSAHLYSHPVEHSSRIVYISASAAMDIFSNARCKMRNLALHHWWRKHRPGIDHVPLISVAGAVRMSFSLSHVYTIQPVVKPVVQPGLTTGCIV